MFMCFDSYAIKYDNDDEHGKDGMSTFMIDLTKNGNYFFTAIFAIESFVKLAAMSPRFFFQVGWVPSSHSMPLSSYVNFT